MQENENNSLNHLYLCFYFNGFILFYLSKALFYVYGAY